METRKQKERRDAESARKGRNRKGGSGQGGRDRGREKGNNKLTDNHKGESQWLLNALAL